MRLACPYLSRSRWGGKKIWNVRGGRRRRRKRRKRRREGSKGIMTICEKSRKKNKSDEPVWSGLKQDGVKHHPAREHVSGKCLVYQSTTRKPGLKTSGSVADWLKKGWGRVRGRCRHLWNENVTNGPCCRSLQHPLLFFSSYYFLILFCFVLLACASLCRVSVIEALQR